MEGTKKIDKVGIDVGLILELLKKLENNQKILLKIQTDRDIWKDKYDKLKLLYDKTWI